MKHMILSSYKVSQGNTLYLTCDPSQLARKAGKRLQLIQEENVPHCHAYEPYKSDVGRTPPVFTTVEVKVKKNKGG